MSESKRKDKLKELSVNICPRCSKEQMDVEASYCSNCGLNLEDQMFLTKYCPSCGSMEIHYLGDATDDHRSFCMWKCDVCKSEFWVHPKTYIYDSDLNKLVT